MMLGRRSHLILLLVVFVTGCGAGLKQRWGDFNAFYNTFYNAQQSYKSGIRSMESQSFVLNPERPIRIHRTPVRAGQADFEKAIQKSADILREHAASKWVDDALLLIGKSYFYQSQFFSAEQKFNEVLAATSNPEIRQQAILWNSLNMLETNRIAEGISYIQNAIDSDEYEWDRETLAELNLVLAQLYVESEDYDLAIESLSAGVSEIDDEQLRSRAFFLYGQLLQRSERYDEALQAYRSVSRKYPEYTLIFYSQVKQNEVLREMGQYDQAYRNLVSMSRDDKNFEQIGDLNYEIARTLQYQGEVSKAFEVLNEVIYASIRPPSRETIAKSHYVLAELYRFDFHDFKLAAAHYDTASRSVQDLERLPEYFNASDLAQSFGSFSRLSAEVTALDSLVWLSTLSEVDLNTYVDSVRTIRTAEYERQMRQDQLRGTTVINTTTQGNNNQTGGPREFGFLSHRNPELVRQAAESFAALWDQRPLVDNWRRLQAVRTSGGGLSASTDLSEASSTNQIQRNRSISSNGSEISDAMLNIDLSSIPSDSIALATTKDRITGLSYEIGNIYFLNLNLPDSAMRYYDRAIYEYTRASIRPQAIYTKADMYLATGDTLSANPYIEMMLDEYPSHRITERLMVRLDMEQDDSDQFITDLERQEQGISDLRTKLIDLSPADVITEIDLFILQHSESPFMDQIIMRKALSYAQIASNDPLTIAKMNALNEALRVWSDSLANFNAQKEMWIEQLSDTTLAASERERLANLADSSLTAPNFDAYFPFMSAEWDSVRSALTHVIENYSSSSYAEQAKVLMKDLSIPESLIIVPNSVESPGTETHDAEGAQSTEIKKPDGLLDHRPMNQNPDRHTSADSTTSARPVSLPDSVNLNHSNSVHPDTTTSKSFKSYLVSSF
jgi:tetratricopeptide (TPR) repeat protein